MSNITTSVAICMSICCLKSVLFTYLSAYFNLYHAYRSVYPWIHIDFLYDRSLVRYYRGLTGVAGIY